MITIPLWLFASMCALAGTALITAVTSWLRAQRTVDRIMADELDRHWDDMPVALAFDGARAGATRPVLVTVTEQVPRVDDPARGDRS